MITYISLFLGAISAIVGALLTPKRKAADGKESYSPWALVFVILPLVAFGVAAWDNYNKDADQKKQVKNLDAQLGAANKLTGSLEHQVELSNEVIKGLQTRVETSIKRVEVTEARITYSFSLKEARFGDELPGLLQNLTIAELVGYDDKAGQLHLGVKSNMFDFFPLPGSYKRVNELIVKGLADMSQFAPPVLMISKKGVVTEGLHNSGRKAVEMPLPGIVIFDEDKLPAGVASYVMSNPRSLDTIPPLYIALAEESWFIPDHDAKNPVLELTWRFRFLNNHSAGLITTDDFQDADVEVFAPRPNPNYDQSPNLMFFRSPFGKITEVEVSAGGHLFKWGSGSNKSDQTIVRDETAKGKFDLLGQLVHLRPQPQKATTVNSP